MCQNFRSYLQETFLKRSRNNPSYSLRAFARSLEMDASPLSAMLRGKRKITQKTIEHISSKLGLGPKEIEEICGGNEQVDSLAQDTFEIISDWYHYAILELTRVEGFVSDLAWVSRKLHISFAETQAAVERLQRTGLLKIVDGRWIDTTEKITTNFKPNYTSAALMKLQKQVLEQSLKSLEQVSIDKREHSNITMAIDPSDMPLAKERIKAFRRSLCHELEGKGKPKEVYQMAISIFPLTECEEKQ